MAKFLKTNDISARLEDIIRETEAGQKLVLVSPYLQISPRLIEDLKDANRRRVKITLIYGKKRLPQEEEELNALQNLSLYFKETLHAKCYYNEKQLIITSMNLLDFSEKTNYEMGVLVRKEEEEDKAIYDLAVEEVEIIRRHSDEIKKPSSLVAAGKAFMGAVNVLIDDVAAMPKRGFCIRCGQAMDYNTYRPLCEEHFAKWNVHKDSKYPEKYCHRCGKPRRNVCKDRPLCLACYKNQ